MGEVYPCAISLLQSGHVDMTAMVTHKPSLAEASAAAVAHTGNEAGLVKTVICPGS